MSDLTVNESVRLWLDRMPERTGSNHSDFYIGVAGLFDVLGGELTAKQKAAARCELERNGHDDRGGRVPRFRVLFASTKNGLVPARIWREAGGKASDRRAGNFVRVPEGSRAWVHWWKADEAEGPDTFGRFVPDETADEIDDTLLSVKGPDGAVTLESAAKVFQLQGSRPRDRRARARVMLAASSRFQSVGKGRYYDVRDKRVPQKVRLKLEALCLSRAEAVVAGENKRLGVLESGQRLVVNWIDTGKTYFDKRVK